MGLYVPKMIKKTYHRCTVCIKKNEFNISIAVLHISGLLIYLEFKIKRQFLKNYQNTYDSTVLFKYIFINRIQLIEAANISAAFFLCRPMMKHNSCHNFLINFKTTFHALLLCIHICEIGCRKCKIK